MSAEDPERENWFPIRMTYKLWDVIKAEAIREKIEVDEMFRDLIHDGLEARRTKRRTEGQRRGKGPGKSK